MAGSGGGKKALDADLRTVHLRCGSDIRVALGQASYGGDFLEFADPFCQGPVRELPLTELIALRAHFLAEAYGLPPQKALGRLEAEYGALERLADYERVVLWFEHDSYDQLILAYLLARLARQPLPRVELICADRAPGNEPVEPRFLGLGQLSPGALALLWSERRPVDEALLALGTRVWAALGADEPGELHRLAREGTPALPAMAKAIMRHLEELPWCGDGLSLTERLTLELLRDYGTLSGGQLFRHLTLDREPLPFLGDEMYWHVLDGLEESREPVLEASPREGPWQARRLRLTAVGRALLEGDGQWLTLWTGERWVGGVSLRADSDGWCWDPAVRAPLPRPRDG